MRIERMRRSVISLGLVLTCGAMVLAGCGKASVAKPPTSASHPKPTAVPSPLVSFAAYSDPLLKTTLSEASGVLSRLRTAEKKNADLSLLGDQCTLAGGDMSSSRSAIVSGYLPAAATPYKQIIAGYKLVLGATDECGTAADGLSHSGVKTAASDLTRGMNELSTVEASLAKWQANKA
jgi:hypothetical protein